MTGLRERQKEQRKEAILNAALALFEQAGFNATTVEQIAERANVSAPTVFNYFGSKQDILLALVERADYAGLEEACAALPAMECMIDSMCTFNSIVVKHELAALPISIWREISQLSGGTQASHQLLNRRLTEQTAARFASAQQRGRISDRYDPKLIADVLNDYSSLLFNRLVHQDPPNLDDYEQQIRRVFELLYHGLQP